MTVRGGVTTGARDLDFITVNPATEAYNEQEKLALARKAAELAIEQQQQSGAENRASAPSRLRTIQATADQTRANADVATGTVQPRISQANSSASSAATAADVARQTAPYTVQNAASTARTGNANADVAVATVPNRIADANNATRSGTANADVTVATAPDKVQGSKIGLRQQEAQTQNTELQSFYKQLDLINAGNPQAAQELAARSGGRQIPQAIIENQQLRQTLTTVAARAKELYPDKPAMQQQFIEAHIKTMADGAQQNPQAQAYAMPPGAPEPVEDNTASDWQIFHREEINPQTGAKEIKSYRLDRYGNGQPEPLEGTGAFVRAGNGNSAGGAAGGKQSVFQQKQSAWLALHPNDAQGALEYASGRRQISDVELNKAAVMMAGREITNNQMLKFKGQAEQTAAVNKRAQEIAAQLRAGFSGQTAPPAATTQPAPAPGATAAPAAPPAGVPPPVRTRNGVTNGPPGDMPGTGARELPFKAATQAHVDWFKAYAPKGAVIVINGKEFTK